MKRLGAVACLVALLVTLSATFCFGASKFEVVETYPYDGMKNTTKDNMVVKLYFSTDVGNEKSRAANKGTFKIENKKGKELPTMILYNNKDSKQAMVLVDTSKVKKDTIKDDTDYKFILSSKFTDNNGNHLDKDVQISFHTLNQGRSTTIYMIMMVVMFGGMFFFSSRSMKKRKEEESKLNEKEEPFNPYKEAKKTGKSVEEVKAAHDKEVAKRAAKRAKLLGNQVEEEEENVTFKVKTKRTVASAGSTFKSPVKKPQTNKSNKNNANKSNKAK